MKRMFSAKWTNEIDDEWINALHRKKGISIEKSLIRRDLARNHIFEWEVTNYQKIQLKTAVPDQKDLHVIQAAIKAKANWILTENIKDFPNDILNDFGIESITPDRFFFEIALQNGIKFLSVLDRSRDNLKSPPLTKQSYIETIRSASMPQLASYLEKVW